VAEIRAPSIRGKLRWWFRVLGGQQKQEAEIFGSTAGECGTSSAIIIRVADTIIQRQWEPISFSGSNSDYVLYFARASGDGARWFAGGAVPAGASFELRLLWKRDISPETKELFDLALDAFLSLGSLGLRNTRGLGSFETKERVFGEELFQSLFKRIQKRSPAFSGNFAAFQGPEDELLDGLGAQLRGLRHGYSAGRPGQVTPSPLGSSNPRQTSAVYLRPVRIGPESCRILVFEAPAERVLGVASRKGAPRLAAGIIPLPKVPPPHIGGRR
jgi:CRISPR type III-B/RAMP module RAMP protein Cmr1